jgi:hypothetical protein
MHLASFMGMSHLVKLIIETGGSIYKRNNRNYRPVDLTDEEETRLIFSSSSSCKFRNLIDRLNLS